MMRLFCAAVIATIANSQCLADHPPSLIETTTKIVEKMRLISHDCRFGGASEQASCLKTVLEDLDRELETELRAAISEQENMWGELATRQQIAKIESAHKAWIGYRQNHCWFDYVKAQSVNVSSRQLENLYCDVVKTLYRMEEIRVDYHHIWK